MKNVTLLEFIWGISIKISEFICNIKLNDFLLLLFIYLVWKLIVHFVFERGVFNVKK